MIPAVILAAFFIVFFGIDIIPNKGHFLGGFDVANYFYWRFLFIKENLLSGVLPLWNPYTYSGTPIVLNPAVYPSFILYLFFPLSWAFNLDTILHLYLASMGMYVFVYYISRSGIAGITAALAFGFNGYSVGRLYAGHLPFLYSMAILPWCIYCVEKGLKEKRTPFYIMAGVLLGLQLLSGHPQNAYYLCMSVSLYYFIRLFTTCKTINKGNILQSAANYLWMPSVAFGISAIMLLPFLVFIPLSDRGGSSYEFATYMSFPFKYFFTFLVPRVNTPFLKTQYELFGYIGILPLVLSFIGLFFSGFRKYKWTFGIILIVSLTFMLGENTPIYHLYYNFLPLIKDMRIPARSIIIVVFCMSIFTGFGIQHITGKNFSKKQQYTVIAFQTFLLMLLFVGTSVFQLPLGSKQIIVSLSLFLIIFFILLFSRRIKNKYTISVLMVAIIFFDFYLNFKPLIPRVPESNFTIQNYENLFKQDPGFYRVNLPVKLDMARALKFHYFNASGYSAASIGDYYYFVHEMAGLPIPELNRSFLNQDLFTADKVFSSRILGIKYAIIRSGDGFDELYKMMAAQQYLPRAYLAETAIFLPRKEDHLNYLKSPEFDPRNNVLLMSSDKGYAHPVSKDFSMDKSLNGRVDIKKYQPNQIELQSDSDSYTYLVLSEIFYPGWKAFVDGKEQPILRADYLLRAVPLTPGKHKIVFTYRPVSFYLGAGVTFFTIILLFGYALYRLYCRSPLKTIVISQPM